MRVSSTLFITGLLTGLLLTAAGCSSNKNDNDPRFRVQADSLDEAKKIAIDGRVSCVDSSQCNPAVALLTMAENDGAYQCTSFLIDSQTLATNSHCIPEDLKTAGAQCKDRIWAIFPQLGDFAGARIDCDHVLFASDISSDAAENADYAFIHLAQPVKRPPLHISREGLKNDSQYRLFKVDPISKTAAIGAMNQTFCKAIHNSLVTFDSSHDESATMTLADCTVIHGNSGSPIVDSNGEVHGLIQALIDPDDLNASMKNRKKFTDSFATLNVGTNYACIDFKKFQIPAPTLPFVCETLAKRSDDEIQKDIRSDMDHALGVTVKQNIIDINSKLDPKFGWNLTTLARNHSENPPVLGDYIELMPVPACMNFPKSHEFLSKTEIEFAVPTFFYKEGYNRYAVRTYELKASHQTIALRMKFDPQTLAIDGQQGSFSLKQADSPELADADYEATLAGCQLSN